MAKQVKSVLVDGEFPAAKLVKDLGTRKSGLRQSIDCHSTEVPTEVWADPGDSSSDWASCVNSWIYEYARSATAPSWNVSCASARYWLYAPSSDDICVLEGPRTQNPDSCPTAHSTCRTSGTVRGRHEWAYFLTTSDGPGARRAGYTNDVNCRTDVRASGAEWSQARVLLRRPPAGPKPSAVVRSTV